MGNISQFHSLPPLPHCRTSSTNIFISYLWRQGFSPAQCSTEVLPPIAHINELKLSWRQGFNPALCETEVPPPFLCSNDSKFFWRQDFSLALFARMNLYPQSWRQGFNLAQCSTEVLPPFVLLIDAIKNLSLDPGFDGVFLDILIGSVKMPFVTN